LDVDNNQLTSLAGVTFPESLNDYLDLSSNQLTSASLACDTFPASLNGLRLNSNQFTSLANVCFPASLT
jgi:hypothetical protein